MSVRLQSKFIAVRTIYLQRSATDYTRAKEILAKYPDATVVEVDDHWQINGLNNAPEMVNSWSQVKAHDLILGVKAAIATRPNGRSTDFIAPSLANGCTGACAYCYVARRKGYANPITTFVNIDKILAHIERKAKKLGTKQLTQACADLISTKACPVDVQGLAQTCPTYWTFDIGENSDVSVDAEISDNVKDTIALFRKLPNAKASFATKFVNQKLLDYDPQGHTRIRFSLMPTEVSKVVDVRTGSIMSRICAINDFVAAGYEVHVNISPVIIFDGWQQAYVELFTELDDRISSAAKKQLAAEVIMLTHNEKLHDLNMQWHPKAEQVYLWRHWDDETDKNYNKFGHDVIQQKKLSQNGMVNLRYKNNVKQKAIFELTQLFEKHLPYCKIRYAF